MRWRAMEEGPDVWCSLQHACACMHGAHTQAHPKRHFEFQPKKGADLDSREEVVCLLWESRKHRRATGREAKHEGDDEMAGAMLCGT